MDRIDPQPLLMTCACARDGPAQATCDVPGIHLQFGVSGRSIGRENVEERACTEAGRGTWFLVAPMTMQLFYRENVL
jgi:hypothetical protein